MRSSSSWQVRLCLKRGELTPIKGLEPDIDPKTGYVIAVLSNYDPDAAGTVADKARELVARREAGARTTGILLLPPR